MGSMMSPPPSAIPPSETGGTPGGGPNVSPAPAQTPPPGASAVLDDVNNLITSARNIAQQFPATVPIVQQMVVLIQQMQMKIVQSMPPTEVAAPPV